MLYFQLLMVMFYLIELISSIQLGLVLLAIHLEVLPQVEMIWHLVVALVAQTLVQFQVVLVQLLRLGLILLNVPMVHPKLDLIQVHAQDFSQLVNYHRLDKNSIGQVSQQIKDSMYMLQAAWIDYEIIIYKLLLL